MAARDFNASLVIGLDLSLERAAAARKLADEEAVRHLSFSVGHARRLPFTSSTFDVVWSSFVLEYLSRQVPAVLGEFARVVRPGGVVAILDIDGFMIRHKRLDAPLARSLKLWHQAVLQRGFDPEIGNKLLGYFRDAGFLDVRVETFDDAELYSKGRPTDDIIQSWRGRLSGMDGIAEALGSEAAAERFRRDYLGLLSAPEHEATGKNWLVWGRVPA